MRQPHTSAHRRTSRFAAAILTVMLGWPVAGIPAGAARPCTGPSCPWSGWQPLTFDVSGYDLGATLLPGGRDGRIDAVVRLLDGGYGLSSQTEPDGTGWTPVTRVADAAPEVNVAGLSRRRSTSVLRDPRGHLRLYDLQAISIHSTSYHLQVNVQTDTGWTGWVGEQGISFLPSQAALDADGRLEVFGDEGYVDLNAIHEAWERPEGGWGERVVMRRARPGWGVGTNADGRLQVFATDETALLSAWQTTPNGSWTEERALAPGNHWFHGVVRNADGRLEVFVSGPEGLFDLWQHAPNTTWSAPARIGPDPGPNRLAVGRGRTGRLEVFLREPTSDVLYTRWQYEPGGAFAPWTPMPGSYRVPVALTNADGDLVLYDGQLWNIQQT